MTDGNKLVTVGPKMTWAQAMTALGISDTTLDYLVKRKIKQDRLGQNAKSARGSNSSCWGIYADSQVAAKTLAVALGYNKKPEVHRSGYYAHYHDEKHIIHIWYSGKIWY